MKIIVPMAGLGSRFAKAKDRNPEYAKPKPFILVRNKPMVRWATGSLPFLEHPGKNGTVKMSDITFVILKEHNDKFEIEKGLKEIYSNNINIIVLDSPTRGAAETAYMAKNHIDPDDDLIITDSDHFFDGRFLKKVIDDNKDKVAGIIPVFIARNEGIPKWSYSLTDSDKTISKVGEKDRELMELGAYANIGAYYFSKGKYFLDQVEETIHKNEMFGDPGKKEFYVAPLFQKLIEKGMKVKAAVTPEVWGLGTPDDLEYFLNKAPHQNPWYE